jgi:hypothetical protein
MGDDLLNGLSILAYLVLGTALIAFFGYWALKKLGPLK